MALKFLLIPFIYCPIVLLQGHEVNPDRDREWIVDSGMTGGIGQYLADIVDFSPEDLWAMEHLSRKYHDIFGLEYNMYFDWLRSDISGAVLRNRDIDQQPTGPRVHWALVLPDSVIEGILAKSSWTNERKVDVLNAVTGVGIRSLVLNGGVLRDTPDLISDVVSSMDLDGREALQVINDTEVVLQEFMPISQSFGFAR